VSSSSATASACAFSQISAASASDGAAADSPAPCSIVSILLDATNILDSATRKPREPTHRARGRSETSIAPRKLGCEVVKVKV